MSDGGRLCVTAHSGMNAILNSHVYLGCYATSVSDVRRVWRTYMRVSQVSCAVRLTFTVRILGLVDV